MLWMFWYEILIVIQISFSKLHAAWDAVITWIFKGDLNFQMYNDYNLINFSI